MAARLDLTIGVASLAYAAWARPLVLTEPAEILLDEMRPRRWRFDGGEEIVYNWD